MISALAFIAQLVTWLLAFVSAYYTLKLQVNKNNIELAAFKAQVDHQLHSIENHYDKLQRAIEGLNLRIDKYFAYEKKNRSGL